MEVHDGQKQVIRAIETVVDSKLNSFNNTTSSFGIVTEDPVGFSATVKVGQNTYTCILPENLHSWIQKDDVVIVQDMFNDGQKKIVTGKTGQSRPADPALVFFNEETEMIESGVDGVFFGENKQTYATVDEFGNK